MATTTTNLGLTKPAGTDKIRIAQINGNMDIIDNAIGAVGTTPIQTQINAVQDGLAIVSNGNTHAAIAAGQFVYVKGHGSLSDGLYTANSAIAANATLSSSNLTADDSGGLNALNDQITNVNSKFTKYVGTASGSTRQEFVTNLVPLINSNFTISSLANGTVLAGSATWSGNGYCAWTLTRNAGGANILVQIGGIVVSALVNTSNLSIEMFTDLNDNLSPSEYTSPTMASNVTLASGGYAKIGKIVIVSMRITTSASITAICSNLPAPLVASGVADSQGVVELATNTQTPCYIAKNGSAIFSASVSTTPLIISGTYISQN